MRVTSIIAWTMLAALLGVGCSKSEPQAAPESEIRVAAATVSAEDLAAIERLAAYLTWQSAIGLEEGLTASAAANYLVWNGTYSAEQCIARTRRQLGYLTGVVFRVKVRRESVTPAPGRVPPELGSVPEGRLYSVTSDVSISARGSTDELATVAQRQDITVLPDGNAKLFGRCA